MQKVGGHRLDKSHAPNSWHGTAQPLSLLNVRELAPTLWGARHLLPLLPALPSAVASLTHRPWCNSTLHKLSHKCQESGILKAFHRKAQTRATTDPQGGTQLPLPWRGVTQHQGCTLIKSQERVKARCFLAGRWNEMDLGIYFFFFTIKRWGRATKGYWKTYSELSCLTHVDTEAMVTQWGCHVENAAFPATSWLQGKSCPVKSLDRGESVWQCEEAARWAEHASGGHNFLPMISAPNMLHSTCLRWEEPADPWETIMCSRRQSCKELGRGWKRRGESVSWFLPLAFPRDCWSWARDTYWTIQQQS